jgi:VWFA-related protein
MLARPATLIISVALPFCIAASSCLQSQTNTETSPATDSQKTDLKKTDSKKADQSYVIRSSTRLVQVEVIAQDRAGSPVTGLTKESFTIFDDGKPQKIAFFAATAPVRTPSRPLAANVFTNRSDLKGQDPAATIVILFDSLNTSFEDQSYARQNILRFLRSVRPQDRVAIFALTTHLVPLHDFTEDLASLQSSVDRFSPRLLAAFDASHPANFHVPALAGDPSWEAFEGHVNNANAEIADFHTINSYRATYAAVVEIADYVAEIPGRKSLVWVSDGIPIQIGSRIGVPDRDDFRLDDSVPPGISDAGNLSGLARVLNRVDMSIYPVDAHGVEGDDSAAGFTRRQDQRDSFRLLADNTGGKAFYGTNDIAGAIESAVEDGRYAYTLAYYPDHGVWDGRFRKIKIEAALPGTHLRYRRGYFALPERAEGDTSMKNDLADAARSPLDAATLGLTVATKNLPPSSSRLLQLQVTLDPKQFLLRDQDHRRQGGLDLLFVQKDSDGKFLAAEKQHFEVNFDRREYDSLAKTGLTLQRKLQVDPGSTEIHVLVREGGSGAIGSVTIPVKSLL